MALPKFQTVLQELRNLQDRWATILDPIVDNPASNVLVLPNVNLKVGRNDIAHRLGKKLQGWYVVRQKGASALYDGQDANPTPQLTLTLYATQAVVVTLAVF